MGYVLWVRATPVRQRPEHGVYDFFSKHPLIHHRRYLRPIFVLHQTSVFYHIFKSDFLLERSSRPLPPLSASAHPSLGKAGRDMQIRTGRAFPGANVELVA
jgi:hypothetical protein